MRFAKRFILILLTAVVCLSNCSCTLKGEDADLEDIKKNITVDYEEGDKEAYPFAVTRYNSYIDLNMSIFASEIVLDALFYGGDIAAVISDTVSALIKLDKAVSLSKADSYLSRLNAAGAGVKVEIDAFCYELLLAAKEVYTETGGAFNAALSPLSKLWHVDIEGIDLYRPDIFFPITYPDSLPSLEQIAALKSATDMNNLELEKKDGKYYAVKRAAAMALDLGGIAKGYAVDLIKEFCRQRKVVSANINLSGNLYFVGKMLFEGKFRDWPVGVTNPRPLIIEDILQGRGFICAFESAGDVSIVTSGDYERFYLFSYDGGQSYLEVPHIIDPATGFPYALSYDETGGRYVSDGTNVVSCTVMASSSMLADAYATAVCVKGIEAGAAFLQEKGLKGIIFALGGEGKGRMAVVGDVPFYDTDVYGDYKNYTLLTVA